MRPPAGGRRVDNHDVGAVMLKLGTRTQTHKHTYTHEDHFVLVTLLLLLLLLWSGFMPNFWKRWADTTA